MQSLRVHVPQAGVFALALLAAIALPVGAVEVDRTKFDHVTTGFPLDGQHLNLRCEQCHLHGIFTGTSKQCLSHQNKLRIGRKKSSKSAI